MLQCRVPIIFLDYFLLECISDNDKALFSRARAFIQARVSLEDAIESMAKVSEESFTRNVERKTQV